VQLPIQAWITYNEGMAQDSKENPSPESGPQPRRIDFGWEGVAERRIQEALAKGEFDNLPGAGKPIPGLDKPHDDLWWVKNLVNREGLTAIPEPPSALPSHTRERRQCLLRRLSESRMLGVFRRR
jgi:hypothetical protein